jgi:hypothetical protein
LLKYKEDQARVASHGIEMLLRAAQLSPPS